MTVSNTSTINRFTTNGVTVDFPFTFYITEASQVKCQTVDSEGGLTDYTNFTISKAPDNNGGTLTTGDILNNVEFVVYRDTPITQETDYVKGGRFPAESHEAALDKLTLQNQEQQEEIERAMVLPIGEKEWNARGKRLVNLGSGENDTDAANISDIFVRTYPKSVIDNKDAQTLADAKEYANGLSQLKRFESAPVTLAAGQDTVEITGFNASKSVYFLISPLSDDAPTFRLWKDVHYTVADVITETIDLLISVESGWSIAASSSDPSGTGIISTASQYITVENLQAEIGLKNGFVATVIELGRAQFLISPIGTTANVGDIPLATGQVAVLQSLPDGSFDVRAFGVKDDQDDVLGSQLEHFSLAAQRALLSSCIVTIPVIKVRLSGSDLTHDVIWNVNSKAVFTNLPGVPPTFVYNLKILGGKINITRSGVGVGFKYFGDPAYTFQSKTGRTMTTGVVNASSTNGAVSVLGATCTSLNTGVTPDQSGIGVTSKVLNDNTTTGHSAWGGYDEAIRYNGDVTGNTYGRETSFSNGGTTCKILKPYDNLNVDETSIVGHAVSCGLNNYTGPVTAFSYWSRTAASTRAYKGLVVLDETIATGAYLNEVIAMPDNHGFSWYAPSNNLGAYLKYVNDAEGNSARLGVLNETFTDVKILNVSWDKFTMGSSSTDIGSTDLRFKSIYLQNAPDVVSDTNKKTSKRTLSTDEINAGLALARNVQMFKWVAEVAEKGEPDAYYHASVMAQEAWQILIDNGLDPTDYGFISNSTDGWSVMQSELSMLMSAAIVQRQDELELRLAALEAL